VAARGVGCLLGERGQSLDRRDGLPREPPSAVLAGGCHAAAGLQRCQLVAELPDQRACLVGALVLVLDGTLERLELRLRVRQLARVRALLLDARACK
jgi:hypothetical protein